MTDRPTAQQLAETVRAALFPQTEGLNELDELVRRVESYRIEADRVLRDFNDLELDYGRLTQIVRAAERTAEDFSCPHGCSLDREFCPNGCRI